MGHAREGRGPEIGDALSQAAFWAPHLNTVVYSGHAAAREVIRKHELSKRVDILIVAYDTAVRDGRLVLYGRDRAWSTLVVDEGPSRDIFFSAC